MNNKARIYHHLVTGFLFAAFILQCFSKNLIVADYYLNTGAYAKNCVNKSKPQLRCKGKCQMMKKLREEQKREEQQSERKYENKSEDPLSSNSFFASFTDPFILVSISQNIYPLTIGDTRDIYCELLRPPGA